MSVLVDAGSRVVVQGITGREGTFHARQCREYGTKVVAGVTPGRGGTDHDGVPVFDTVREAVGRQGAALSLILVPPRPRPTPSWRLPPPESAWRSASRRE